MTMTPDRIEKEVMFFSEAWINGNRKYVVAAIINRIQEDVIAGIVYIDQFS